MEEISKRGENDNHWASFSLKKYWDLHFFPASSKLFVYEQFLSEQKYNQTVHLFLNPIIVGPWQCTPNRTWHRIAIVLISALRGAFHTTPTPIYPTFPFCSPGFSVFPIHPTQYMSNAIPMTLLSGGGSTISTRRATADDSESSNAVTNECVCLPLSVFRMEDYRLTCASTRTQIPAANIGVSTISLAVPSPTFHPSTLRYIIYSIHPLAYILRVNREPASAASGSATEDPVASRPNSTTIDSGIGTCVITGANHWCKHIFAIVSRDHYPQHARIWGQNYVVEAS